MMKIDFVFSAGETYDFFLTGGQRIMVGVFTDMEYLIYGFVVGAGPSMGKTITIRKSAVVAIMERKDITEKLKANM